MLEANNILTEGQNYTDTITLVLAERTKRRCLMKTDAGVEFLLNLSAAIPLNEGDILKLNNGSLIRVKAADEDVLDIETDDLLLFAQLAWSLGNKHLPVEITRSFIRIRYDYVIEQDFSVIKKITLRRHRAPFSPSSPYAKGHH